MSDGFSILITRPRGQEPYQEDWIAHIPHQTDAIVAVQNAAGELNDSKVEILNTMPHSDHANAGVDEGPVRKKEDLSQIVNRST